MEKEQVDKIRQSILQQIESQDMPEDSKSKLREQVENASDEEIIQFVQQQSKGDSGESGEKIECIFCGIAEGKVQTFKIFENSEVAAFLDINPAIVGQTIIIPKKHAQFLFQLPDSTVEALFLAVKKIMPILINVTKAEGISIFIPQGIGQNLPHIAVNLIPRFKEDKDKVQFVWERKKADAAELKNIADELSARIGKEEAEDKRNIEQLEKRKKDEEDDVQKIMKQMRRRA